MLQIEIDNGSGFCFGVTTAIKKAEEELATGQTLYCLGDIVHIGMECERLRQMGLVTINHEELEKLHDAKVLLRAHGEPPETYELARRNNIEIIDATCPVVLQLQKRIKKQFDANPDAQIVIFGKQGHAEVLGLVGQTQGRAIVIESFDEVVKLDYTRDIYLYSQTTKSLDEFHRIIEYIQQHISPDATFRSFDTICRSVANRMPNISQFAARHDLILFVCGRKSSNGKVLFGECKRVNDNTHLIEGPEEIDRSWLDDIKTVGICGATSTPKWLMEKCREALMKITFIICLLMFGLNVMAQYDIIPMPTSIKMDKRGRTLAMTPEPRVTERLNSQVTSPEGWRLTVNEKGITVEGSTAAGLFYGQQALRQILVDAPQSLPYAVVESAPRFPYRAMHLDVCRHFFDKHFVMQYIDMLALHGMNRLHWHLSDDQGWRIEIKSRPRLTEVGSVRQRTVIGRNTGLYDNVSHGGYYTQEDIREIVEYAAQRHITIIPEIDMPGHMLAALAAYPELGCTGGPYEVSPDWGVFDDILCAGNDSVYRFLEDVIDEVCELFPSKFIHMGGDEAPRTRWQQCPRCQQKMRAEHLSTEAQLQGYMVRYVEKYLAGKGRRMIGWDEIADCDIDSSAVIMSWRGVSEGIVAAQQQHDVIMVPCDRLYFDYYQLPEDDTWNKPLLIGGYVPLQKVYDFDPAPDSLSADIRRHIIGTQANVWTEYIPYKELLEYQALPRMAALAEVQWVAPSQKDYNGFLLRLSRLLALYDRYGWRYCKEKGKEE